jgi:integrase
MKLRKFGRLATRSTDPSAPDGDGLYLLVKETGGMPWVPRYVFAGKRRDMGLGAYPALTLAKAREVASEARKLIASGIDPLTKRETDEAETRAKAKRIPHFGEMAEEVIKAKSSEWRNSNRRAQWEMTLREHAKLLANMPVNDITVADVLATLAPLWLKVPETTLRLRGRIEAALDAAKVKGFRAGENPAAWRGNLAHLLAKPKKLSRGHHRALRFQDVPAFVAQLRERGGVVSQALEFCILTAARSGEVRGATWGEIDLAEMVWTIPASRMKAGMEPRVALSTRAVEILEARSTVRAREDGSELVFEGRTKGTPLSDMSLSMAVRRMNADATPHGFRSAFRDWCGDATDYPRELAESALAHVIGNKAEAAYRRGDALEKRRAMTEAWAAFLSLNNALTVAEL